MVRRSNGFVTKKPHQKSRGGCLICKRKKVKCNEHQPICGYCSIRKLVCEYPPEPNSAYKSPSSTSSLARSILPVTESNIVEFDTDFNDSSIEIPPWLVPTAFTSTGQLAPLDHKLLQHYKTHTWHTFAVRQSAIIQTLHCDSIPQLSVTHPFLLYALLSIAASHSNALCPSKQVANQALVYRQKTFQVYTKALQSITAENYEAILVTSTFLLALIPSPTGQGAGYDEEHLNWTYSVLKLSEGLRVLASLRWTQGIEKLTVFPLICRELRTLPPPPLIKDSGLDAPVGPLGTTPDQPNPAPTYRAQQPQAFRLFLPPPLMQLLQTINDPLASGLINFQGGMLRPAFHALSPIFLSLYYYRRNPDFYVRLSAFPSFLMPDFMQLVKEREPRALVLVAWWLAMVDLLPTRWWFETKVGCILGAIERVMETRWLGGIGAHDILIKNALSGAQRVVKTFKEYGEEEAAKSIFEDWPGVDWKTGPTKAEEWEFEQLLDLSDITDIGVV